MKLNKILVAASLAILPQISIASDYYVATSQLNVRVGAGTHHQVIFTLQKGDEVEVLSKLGDWYEIKHRGNIGYAHSNYLKYASNAELEQPQQSSFRDSASYVIVILVLIALVWILPILIIVSSGKTTSDEKIAWVLAVIFISWFAWIFYML